MKGALLALCALKMVQAHLTMTAVYTDIEKNDKIENKGLQNAQIRRPGGAPFQQCWGKSDTLKTMGTVLAGQDIMGKCLSGAGHGGGHCAWLVQHPSTKKWFKFSEVPDCTDGTLPNDNAYPFKIPKGVPKECDTPEGCIFGWVWTPILSGLCEIYMNCFRFRVRGATGGIENIAERNLEFPIGQCVRPSREKGDSFHFTVHYGKVFRDDYMGGEDAITTEAASVPDFKPIEPQKPVDPSGDDDPLCKEGEALYSTGLPEFHVVSIGDTLTEIGKEYDLDAIVPEDERTYDALYQLNKCDGERPKPDCNKPIAKNSDGKDCMAGSVNLICPGQKIRLPQKACGTKVCGANGIFVAQLQRCVCVVGYSGAFCERSNTEGNAEASSSAIATISAALTVVALAQL